MKKILSACLVLLGVQIAHAQTITLTSSNSYAIGDKFVSYEYEAGDITKEALDAPASSRDFSGKTLKSSYQNEVIAVPSEDALTYPNANLAIQANKSSKTEFQYYQTTENALINWGYKNTDIGTTVNTDGYKYLEYPLSLNGSFTDDFSGTGTVSAMGMELTGTRTASVSASADEEVSLVLNNGVSYEKALRVKSVATITDVASFGQVQLTSVSELTMYTWYVPTVKFPVLSVVFTTVTVNGTKATESVLLLQNDSETPTGIAHLELSKEVNLFPNPSNSRINLSYGLREAADLKVTVNSIDGKVVKTLFEGRQTAGEQQISGDVSALQRGMYYVEMVAGERRKVSKFVVE
jgi:hypothetical protein